MFSKEFKIKNFPIFPQTLFMMVCLLGSLRSIHIAVKVLEASVEPLVGLSGLHIDGHILYVGSKLAR